jgi:diguanylate cyclase (GGDEF)-like protein
MRSLTERHERTGSHFGYLLCDIDGLKLVNDELGSDAGDQVIREVGRRLAEAVRQGDSIARMTGDQFVVLCVDAESFQVERIARDLVAEVTGGRLDVGGSAIQPSISIGAVSTSDVEPGALVSAAGAAMHRAKQHGHGSVALFNAAAPRDHRSRLELLADLREAVTAGTMRLHYQPVVRLSTNEVTSAEALMRWHRPGYGEVPPSVFIPLAEETGLIAQLTEWSLHQACRDAAKWPGGRAVAVNLSARQLQADLVDIVRDALEASGLPADRLWLEVTETAVFRDVPLAAERLRAVVGLGVRIALDDFGTGYSSLANLRDFPVHALKLDRSFIAGLGRNPDDTAIVTTLIQLAATLRLRLVAEGVETAEQAHHLRRLGCDYAQGYFWRPALAVHEFVTAISDIESSGPPDSGPSLPARRTKPPDQAVITRIMALSDQGASPSSIAAALNAEGISAPTGKRWHRATVAVVVADQHAHPQED